MTDPTDDILGDLKNLRKGRGIETPEITARLGRALWAACDVESDDSPEVARRKVEDRLNAAAKRLPDDLALAAKVALGMHPRARHRLLKERVQWLAEHLGRDERTARRRADDGLARLAAAAASHSPPPGTSLGSAADDWYVQSFHVLLRLDRPQPESMERYEIVAGRDGLDSIEAMFGVPKDPTARETDHGLLVEVLYGATLLSMEHDTESLFRLVLQLPAPLRAGQRHEYGMVYRVPPNQPMRLHYILASRRRCDYFDLRVRFDRHRLPDRIWRVTEALHRTVDEGRPSADILSPDPAGEVHVKFRELRPGFGYGVQWTAMPTGELYHLGAPPLATALPASRALG